MKIIVIGGGASGLVAAIQAKRKGHDVSIIEKNSKCGKKILISGNGRCNYFNDDFSIEHYHSNNIAILEKYINLENKEKILAFFDSIGIVPRIKDGYYYPYTNTSITILNALLIEVKRLNINIINDEVIDIDGNNVIGKNNSYKASKIILAVGSIASSEDNHFGYDYLLRTNHKLSIIKPALVQLKLDVPYLKEWAGIRCEARVSLYIDNKYIDSQVGELQLTNYGISGICIMNLSGRIALALEKHKVEIKINFLSFINDVESYIINLSNKFNNKTIIELLETLINYKLLYIILKLSKIKDNSYIKDLSKNEFTNLINNLTNLNLEIKDTRGYSNAQVVTGGLLLTEVDENFKSKKIDNLYIAGELLDVDGDCGGYNLGFAWLTGIIIGNNI